MFLAINLLSQESSRRSSEVEAQTIAKIVEEVRRLFKKIFQRGHSERRGEAYSVPYVEPLSDVRTKPEGFFNSLFSEARM